MVILSLNGACPQGLPPIDKETDSYPPKSRPESLTNRY